MNGPRLGTTPIFLRQPIESDAGLRQTWFAAPEVVRNAFFGEQPDEQLTRLRADAIDTSRYVWTVMHADSPVGWVQLSGIDHLREHTAMIAYAIGREFRRVGAATVAVSLVCEFAGGSLGLSSVMADVLTDNAASQRVLAKAGFVRTERFTERTLPNQGLCRFEEWRFTRPD